MLHEFLAAAFSKALGLQTWKLLRYDRVYIVVYIWVNWDNGKDNGIYYILIE